MANKIVNQGMVYGSTEGSVSAIIQDILNGTDKATYNLGDWIHVKLDLTPYIDMAIEMANAEDAFGLGVTTREDWHFNGVNVGYECSGNVDATFEFANFNFYSYNDTTND